MMSVYNNQFRINNHYFFHLILIFFHLIRMFFTSLNWIQGFPISFSYFLFRFVYLGDVFDTMREVFSLTLSIVFPLIGIATRRSPLRISPNCGPSIQVRRGTAFETSPAPRPDRPRALEGIAPDRPHISGMKNLQVLRPLARTTQQVERTSTNRREK